MNVTATVDIGDVLDLAATFLDGRKAAEDLTKRLTNAVYHDSAERFEAEGPGWEPRQQSDEETAANIAHAIEHAKAQTIAVVRKKLAKDLLRAQRNAVRAHINEPAYSTRGRAQRSSRTLEHHRALLAEFDRQVAGGLVGHSLVKPEGDKRLAKKLASVEDRLRRTGEHLEQRAREAGGKLLGGLARANRPTTRGLEGEVRNMAPFSEAQNDGGRVGNGAVLPSRPFLGDTPDLEATLEETTDTWLSHLGAE